MNKDVNTWLLNILSEDGKKLYNDLMENICDDCNNIRCLLLYLTENEDNNVIPAVIDHISGMCNLDEDDEVINYKNLKPLANFHNEYYEQLLKAFYNSYNAFQYYFKVVEYIDSDNFSDDDFEKMINNILESLEHFSNGLNYLSDLILNYCAIQYIMYANDGQRRCREYMSNNGMGNFTGYMSDQIIKMEFQKMHAKVLTIVLPFKNQDIDNIPNHLSMYDATALANLAVNNGVNKASTKFAEVMNDCGGNYNVLNLFIFCTTYYSAIWSIYLEQSKYKISIDSEVALPLKEFAGSLEEFNDGKKNIYKKIIDSYYNAKKELEVDVSEIITKKIFKKVYKSFLREVGRIDETTAYYWYTKMIEEIKELTSL